MAGLLVGALLPPLSAQTASDPARAQTAADPCAARWDVVLGAERIASGTNAGRHAVKWNRCTGEAMWCSTSNHNRFDVKEEVRAWQRFPVK
ncbi:MAG: hypothetical protein H6Q87_1024 [candidate division NC10 bacterium]|nr:hypothetical protein [candidate division NC10 bacterium]